MNKYLNKFMPQFFFIYIALNIDLVQHNYFCIEKYWLYLKVVHFVYHFYASIARQRGIIFLSYSYVRPYDPYIVSGRKPQFT